MPSSSDEAQRMDLSPSPKNDGTMAFRLGVVERWVVGVGAAILLSLSGIVYNRIDTQLDSQTVLMSTLTTNQAVMSSQLTTMNSQLADMPGTSRKVTEHEVRLNALESDVKELRGTRGLR